MRPFLSGKHARAYNFYGDSHAKLCFYVTAYTKVMKVTT